LKVIDLFSGVGGFSTGFSQAGFKISRAVEFDKQIADSFLFNHQNVEMIVDDIRNIDQSGTFERRECEVIIGGPPCQGFSMAGARIRSNFIDDPRNYLFKHYYNVVQAIQPKMFVMENVKGLLTMENGRIFNEIVSSFEKMNDGSNDRYHIYHKIFKASSYGIPQSRERVVVFGVKGREVDLDFEMDRARERIVRKHPSFFNPCTVWDAISNLGPTSDSGIVINNSPETDYQKYLASDSDYICNHTMTSHSSEAIGRMKKIGCGDVTPRFPDTGIYANPTVHSVGIGAPAFPMPASGGTSALLATARPASKAFILPKITGWTASILIFLRKLKLLSAKTASPYRGVY